MSTAVAPVPSGVSAPPVASTRCSSCRRILDFAPDAAFWALRVSRYSNPARARRASTPLIMSVMVMPSPPPRSHPSVPSSLAWESPANSMSARYSSGVEVCLRRSCSAASAANPACAARAMADARAALKMTVARVCAMVSTANTPRFLRALGPRGGRLLPRLLAAPFEGGAVRVVFLVECVLTVGLSSCSPGCWPLRAVSYTPYFREHSGRFHPLGCVGIYDPPLTTWPSYARGVAGWCRWCCQAVAAGDRAVIGPLWPRPRIVALGL